MQVWNPLKLHASCSPDPLLAVLLQVWDLNTMMRMKTLNGHTDAVRALAVAGGKLFSGSYDGRSVHALRVVKQVSR
jgi:WD40 repeat protein